MTTLPIAWPEAQRICDIPEVREALDKFAADAHEEHMLPMVSIIMGHASAKGRAAGLEEAARDCKAHADIFAGDERELVRMVRGALLTEADRICALSPTSSDAGKDEKS